MATSPIPPMLIQLQLETEKINGQLQQVTSGIDNLGKTVQKQGTILNNFKSIFAGVFGANIATQGLMALQGLVRQSIKDTADYEHGIAQLRAGLESTNNVAGLNVEAMKQQASALEKLSAVDENLILQSQAVFQTFTNVRNVVGEGNDIFNQATQSALDLSVKMGGDLQGATVQLGKALNDPIKGITALTRVGVVFTQAQKDQIKALVASGDVMGAQKIILAEMNTEFGGAAKAAGDTFAGAVFRAKDKVQDLVRNITMGLQPILLQIGKTIGWLVNTFIKPFTDFLVKNKEAVMAFAAVLGIAVTALYAYKAAVIVTTVAQEVYAVVTTLMKGAQLASIASTNGLAASMLALNAVMRANPIALIVTAIAALVAGFVIAWNHSESFRKVMIAIGKAGIIAIGYLIEWFGKLLVAIIKIQSGPLTLLLKGLALLKVPGAKEALDGISKAVDGVGDFFDKTAKSVKGYADTLDGLEKKKITLPSFGGKADSGVNGTTNLPTGTDPATVKAKAAAEKKRLEDITKAMKDAAEIQKDMNDVIANGEKRKAEEFKAHTESIIKITANFAKKEAELTKSYNEEQAKIRKEYADKATALTQEAATKQKDIIQKSIDQLRNAFKSGTSFSLADMFKTSSTSGGLIDALKAKLQGAKDLQANAAALAGKGYSQTFIEEIVKQGPDTGNQMAKAILTASDDATKELQDLYSQVNNISDNGLNDLAKTMNSGGKLATQALMDEFSQVGVDLKVALANVNTELSASLAESTKKYSDSLASIHAEMADALAEEQKSYQDAITKIEEATTEKLNSLKAKLADVIATLVSLQASQAQLATAQATPYVAQPLYKYNTQGQTITTPFDTGVGTGKTTPVVVNNTFNSNGIQSTTAVQNAVMNGIKFGTVVATSTATVATPSVNTAQGVQNKLRAASARLLDI